MLILLSVLFFLVEESASTPLRANASVLEQIKDLRASIKALSTKIEPCSYCKVIPKRTCGPCQCKDDSRLLKKYYCDCSNLIPKRDCLEFYQQEIRVNGVYKIHQNTLKIIQVYCDQTTDGGGWTVFQRRQDASVNFYRDWITYKNGFGDLQNEFWLGNENLFTMTLQALHPSGSELRVELEDWEGEKRYAKYGSFQVGNELTAYQLNVGGYSGNAGDGGHGMSYHSGMKFSTCDKDNDPVSYNCAAQYKSGWWYRDCHYVHLNGRYYFYKDKIPSCSGIVWDPFHGNCNSYSLQFSEMKMRRKT